jgi:serine/threonine-protein kinase
MGLVPGSTFAGRYEIGGLLGRGGMGSVYRAVHKELRREVALKVLDAPLVIHGQPDDGAARFEREARSIAKLDHPNIVRILDYGRTRKQQFIAMQLLDGPTLGQILRTSPQLPPGRALHITRQLLFALAHAHARGILHRDLKPDNVMLLGLARGSGPYPTDAHPSMRAILIDFGLAHVTDEAALTAKGACVGSPSYLAPERLDGAEPDVRSDLYAIGVILYEMLAGARPFTGESIGEILLAVRTEPPRPLRAIRKDISRPLDAFIMRALAKDPARRYHSADEMLEGLEDISLVEQADTSHAQEDSAETFLELPLTEPSRWTRLWSWIRFGRWRWNEREASASYP